MLHTLTYRETEIRALIIEGTPWFLGTDILRLFGNSPHDYYRVYTTLPPRLMKQVGAIPGAGAGGNRRLLSIDAVKLAAKIYGVHYLDELNTWLDNLTIPEPEPEPDLRTELIALRSQLDRIIRNLES